LRAWSEWTEKVLYFQPPDPIFYDRVPWDHETAHARIDVLARLTALRGEPDGGRGLVVVAPAWALMTKTLPPLAFRRGTRMVCLGEVIPPSELLTLCVRSGYEMSVVVEDPGTCSQRGSIVDIYPPNQPAPLRLDFFGDEVDSIRRFDPATQRSQERLSEFVLVPASEALPEWAKASAVSLQGLGLAACDHATQQRMGDEVERILKGEHFRGLEYYMPYLYPRPATLLDYAPENTLVVVDDLLGLDVATSTLEEQAQRLRAELVDEGQLPPNFAIPYFTWEEIKTRLSFTCSVALGYPLGEDSSFFDDDTFIAAPRYGGQVQQTLADIDELRSKGERVIVVTRQSERMSDLLTEKSVYVSPCDEVVGAPPAGSIMLMDGIIAEGWVYNPGRLVLLTDAEIFGWVRLKKRRPSRKRGYAPETFFADLKPGDYVVHVEYGIGRYHGIVQKQLGALQREYLEIEYAAGDRLYVPIHQANRVSRYLGPDEREPYMHRLGGNEWATVRDRASRAVRDIAAELLELYAARAVTPGHAFSGDVAWQHELEASFPYEETEDQLSAIEAVKGDMERPKPMDRLICGDVGYGKTEVALRAAFKAVMDGKQVAVLVPTTVLAQQHFHTFRRRLRAFPVNVEMLSRFRSPEEQEEVIQGLLSGKVDIVIGTHRLLSRDVILKDLGLVIIDEEQRFGVSHKEQLKKLRHEVDVLTLTATPIPRTLYMALSGARDMSVIDTPPEDRLPVRTFVTEYDEALVRRAVLRELDRGGQVYYVHNRVLDIYEVATDLRRIVPEATLAVGHGQMPEEELSQVMLGFAQGEYNLLLCTTIIESGLDIPNVNTIIIDDADNFGLAQLYQLRGRVGRGANRAYAYLLFKPPVTEIALKRLQTIQEASELGAGFRVAMRDMEIRGAGELLGAEQHGHIAAIGFDLYCRLLQEAVGDLKDATGDSMEAIHRARHATALASVLDMGSSIDLPLSAYLPDELMPDVALRLRFYRRLARVDSVDEIDALTQEMVDRFGRLPPEVENLLYFLRVRVLAGAAGVPSIAASEGEVAVSLPLALTPDTASRIMAEFSSVRARGTRIWIPLDSDWRPVLLALLGRLEALTPTPLA
jgi:transcription-repair coupling factor (superfamily II helicase)